MDITPCNRREGNMLVMDIALLHCAKISQKQCLFSVIASYMCVMTTDLAFVAYL